MYGRGIADISVTKPAVNTQILAAGQSWITLLRSTSFMYGLVATLQANGAGNVYCNAIDYGGSSILQVHERPGVTPGTYYFCANPSASYPGTWTDGPLLTSTKAAINVNYSGNMTAKCLIWYQKQGDTFALDMSSAAAARTESNLWLYGSLYATIELCRIINAGNPNGQFRYIDIEGRRNSGLAPQIAVMRDATMDLIAGTAQIKFGMECYDLPLPSNDDHPTSADSYHMGLRTGMAIANDHFGGSYPLGPSITSITRGASNRLDIAINVEGGQTLRKPAAPVGFRVFPGNDYLNANGTAKTPIPITDYTWVGSTLQLTLATTGQATVCYPWLDAGDLNYTPGGSETTVIRYSTKQTDRDISLPLRGIKAATVAA